MQARELISRRPRSRATYVNQIPARTGDLRARAEQLRQGSWDINAALLLAEDAEALASSCHLLDRAAVAGNLEDFAECLWTVLDPPRVPDSETLQEMDRRLQALASAEPSSEQESLPVDDEPTTLFGYATAEANGFPLLVRPPADYWRRFASKPPPASTAAPEPTVAPEPPKKEPATLTAPATVQESAPDPVAEAPAVPQAAAIKPPAQPEPEPETETDVAVEADIDTAPRKVFHLGDGADLGKALDQQLRAQGNEIENLRTVDALKESMHRATPSLVLLEGGFEEAIEEIGALVRAARTRSGKRVLLIALSAEKTDLAARLRAMRAGCDAYIVQPGGADAVMARLRELTAAEHADPFRIMIVEDDRSQALFAESILRKNGMDALSVDDASVVLDKLDEFRPDLILMDLNMPVCDGMELTALIREREAYISTPIVFLSGEGDTEKHFEALSAGGDDFLSKPIAPRHLISAVTSRVKRARLLERRRRAAPSTREAIKGVHDSAQLTRRLAEMLSMEDAATRKGGLLYLELADAATCEQRVGHSAFRTLIERLTTLLAAHIGNADMLARSGGHGFLLLNPDLSAEGLEDRAKALRACVAVESFGTTKVPQELKIEVGICPFEAVAGDAKAMIDAAEKALRDAQAAGRGGIALVEAAASADNTEVVVAAIRKALEDSSFRVVFQPIVSLHGEEEEQFQALLRLSTEDGRVYAAAELVPAAEEAGLISDVDRWMFGSCLATIAEHLRDGRHLRLFLSLSSSSVLDATRVEWMRNALDTHRVPAAQISVELRLADAAKSLSAYIRFAMAMKQLGVSLTLSGLEAGMLGTEMLLNLPVDFIKLSPRYTADPDDSLRSELRELVKLAHAGGRRVIAPRVEEARVAASLWASGIDLIQGNFVHQATRDTSYDFHMTGN
ncbi:EAL domain-containing protein [Dokdonella sp.]|uniref:GGDEF/EAL domain-containing response regulator n=1 Tax=Dokdonella sp. TaxID=2291710 RepID=UPI003529935B